MRIALCSAGPSLLNTHDPDAPFDVRIGVNAAVERVACNWWCMGDAATLSKFDPLGAPNIFTMDRGVGLVRERIPQRLEGRRIEPWRALCGRLGAPPRWYDYSAPAALVLTVKLGATAIDIFGVDMTGPFDCLGREGRNRGDIRWDAEHEGGIWRSVLAWVRGCGVEVCVHTPQIYVADQGDRGTVLFDGADVSNRTARCCPAQKWVELFRCDRSGAFVHAGGDIPVDRHFGHVEYQPAAEEVPA